MTVRVEGNSLGVISIIFHPTLNCLKSIIRFFIDVFGTCLQINSF